MRVSTTALRVGDRVRLADGTRGEIVAIHRRWPAFRWSVDLKDHMGRIGPRFMNDAGSVEIIDNIDPMPLPR